MEMGDMEMSVEPLLDWKEQISTAFTFNRLSLPPALPQPFPGISPAKER